MHIERLVIDHPVAFRPLYRVDDLVDGLAHPPIVQGNREREMVPPLKHFIDIFLAVEAFVEHVMKALNVESLERLEQVVHRLHVGDIAGNAMVVGRNPALLAKKHCEVQLRQLFPVAVVAKADVLVQLAIGRDARDVIAEKVILADPVHPCRHEGLFAFCRNLPEDFADALALERLT